MFGLIYVENDRVHFVFRASIVKSYAVFWTNVRSSPLSAESAVVTTKQTTVAQDTTQVASSSIEPVSTEKVSKATTDIDSKTLTNAAQLL